MRRWLALLLAGGALAAASMDPIPDLTVAEDEADAGQRVIRVSGLDADAMLTVAAEGANPLLVPVVAARDPAAGTATITFTLRPSANGIQVVLVEARDGNGGALARSCRVTVTPVNDAPVATPYYLPITVPVAGIRTLDPHASDPDIATGQQTSADLVYTLTTPPTTGHLLLAGVPLALDGTFTQADASAGRVTFRHDGANDGPVSDRYALALSDGIAAPFPLDGVITITATAPTLDLGPGPTTWSEHDAPAAVCPAALISDAEGGQSAGIAITARLLDGTAGDHLSLAADAGGRPGLADSLLTWDGAPLGSVSGGGDGTPLAISFTSRTAGYPEIQAILRRLRFDHVGSDLADGSRSLQVVVAERAGGVLNAAGTSSFAVAAVDDPPTVITRCIGTQRDLPATVLLRASDPDSALLHWRLLGTPSIATLVLDADSGRLRIVPAPGATGAETVAVAVDDLVNAPVSADLLLRITSSDEVRPQPLIEPPVSVLAGDTWTASIPWDAPIAAAAGDDAPADLLLRMADATTLQASWTPGAGTGDATRSFTILAIDETTGSTGRLPVLLRILPRPQGVR